MILYRIKKSPLVREEEYASSTDFAFAAFGFVFFTTSAAAEIYSTDIVLIHPV